MKMSEAQCLCGRVGQFTGPYMYRKKSQQVVVCTCGMIMNWKGGSHGSESKPKKQGRGKQGKAEA